MQQRQLRLGDILDDYCPRERRVTNHAVVAMVGLEVKQTRCTTCEAEHQYKQAKVPASRRKKDSATLYKQVLAGLQQEGENGLHLSRPVEAAAPPPEEATPQVAQASQPAEREEAPPPTAVTGPEPQPDEDARAGDGEDEGPVHRRLIRATLPRPEGAAVRPGPQFTLRQPGARPGSFRGQGARSGQRSGQGSHAGGRPGGAHAAARHPAGGRERQTVLSHHSVGRIRDTHQRPIRHAHPGQPLRHGKKQSK
jgi:hypothetical protein